MSSRKTPKSPGTTPGGYRPSTAGWYLMGTYPEPGTVRPVPRRGSRKASFVKAMAILDQIQQGTTSTQQVPTT